MDDTRRTVEIANRTEVLSVEAERREVAMEQDAAVAGPQGDKGEQGDRGLQGDKGDKGDQGDRGPRGRDGADGAAGAAGDKGDRGDDGLRGHKGDRGDDGDDAWTPEMAVIHTGARCIIEVVDWHNGSGDKPKKGVYLGKDGWTEDLGKATDIRGRPGDMGPRGFPGGGGGGTGSGGSGTTGDNGWSPVFAVVADGERRVLQITDWSGGTGTKPPTGRYLGTTGIVVDIADAVDIRGPAGADGVSGDTGPIGYPGPKGEDGEAGHDGMPGPVGPKGDQGEPGADSGDSGDDGWSPLLAVVEDGERRVLQIVGWTDGDGTPPGVGDYLGPLGLVASIADATDVRGSVGTLGPPGPTGDDGEAGMMGPRGPRGNVLYQDDGVPDPSLGDDDDFYLDNVTDDVFQKIAGVWVAITNIRGVQGDKGDKGDTGDIGPPGPRGDGGEQGDRGPQGAQGPQGDRGDQGAQGPQGDEGDRGDRGLQGDRGPQGDRGDQGAPGPQGDEGDRGDRGIQGDRGLTGATGADGCNGYTAELAVVEDGDRRVLEVVDWIGDGPCDPPFAPAHGLSVVSYSNDLGTGDRTADITVTQSGLVVGGGTVAKLVNGSRTSNASNAVWFQNGSVVGAYIRFQFPTARVIKQARWYQDNTHNPMGEWQWQGSQDGSTWIDIGTTFILGTNNDQINIQVELRDNDTEYLYYQILGISGTWSDIPWIQEVEFMIDGDIGDEGDTSYLYPAGGGSQMVTVNVIGGSVIGDENGYDRNAAPDVTVTASFSPSAGTLSNLVDGSSAVDATGSVQFANGLTNAVITFTFAVAQRIDEITWRQNGTTANGVYDIAASNDGVTFTTLSSAVDIVNGTSTRVAAFTNPDAYLIYRLTQVGGTTSSTPWVKEVFFKCCPTLAASHHYVGADGFVTDISDAVDIRGPAGPAGSDGVDGSGSGSGSGNSPFTDMELLSPVGQDWITSDLNTDEVLLSFENVTGTGNSWVLRLAVSTDNAGSWLPVGILANSNVFGSSIGAGQQVNFVLHYTGLFSGRMVGSGVTTQSGAGTGTEGSLADILEFANEGSQITNLKITMDSLSGTDATPSGSIRVLTKDLSSGDSSMSSGVPGRDGEDGNDGPPGPAGPQGTQGTAGNDGAAGAQGVPGARGDDGDDGAPGYPGAQGPQGAAGNDGAPGSQGVPGARGDDGDDGAPGYPGAQGPQGTAGNDGAAGAAGAQGVPGARGDDGDDGAPGYPGAQGATGAQGNAGNDGAPGSQGVPGPRGEDGDNGVPGIGIQGVPGNDGSQGVPGARGDDGDDGAPGYPGATGAQGTQGTAGNDGAAGAQGVPGARGDDGDDGAPGYPGAPGSTGAQGTAGNDGAAGAQGVPGARGDDGDDGVMGPPGPQGPQGVAGADGASSSGAAAATPGPRGDDGDDGPMGLPMLAYPKPSDLIISDRMRAGELFPVESSTYGVRQLTADLVANGIGLDSTSQIIGSTVANIAEVEAVQRALRTTFREDTVAADLDWKISRYAFGVVQVGASTLILTTSAGVDQGILGFYWSNGVQGLAVIKKIVVSVATGALVGTRTGSMKLNLFRGMNQGVPGTGGQLTPKNTGAGGAVGPPSIHGLSGRNNNPIAYMVYNQNNINVFGDTLLDLQPISSLVGGALNAAGSTQFQNVTLFDHLTALQPLILTQNHCWLIQLSWPAAVTSQNIGYAAHVIWDEWVPTPNDR